MTAALDTPDFLDAKDPFVLFQAWFDEAVKSEPRDPNAISLATVDASGMPNVRLVLAKDYGPNGFTWYTNVQSAKGKELAGNAQAAICYYWKSLGRQVRARGTIAPVTAEEADTYFKSRPRDSQLGAWASFQSDAMPARDAFETRLQEFGDRFADQDVPRPDHWSGYRLTPGHIEFWQERPFRLHDRLVFERQGDSWKTYQLYP